MPASTGQGGLWQKLARWLDVLFLLMLALASFLFPHIHLSPKTIALARLLLLLYLTTVFVFSRLPLIFLGAVREITLASRGRKRVWNRRKLVLTKAPLVLLGAIYLCNTLQPQKFLLSLGQEESSLSAEMKEVGIDEETKEKLAKKQPTLLKSNFKSSEEIRAFVGSHPLGSLKTTVLDLNGQEIATLATIEGETLKIKPERDFRPGKYIVKITNENNQTVLEQNFTWGVLAINTNKSTFLPGENVYLQMAALSDYGHTLCQANLKLEILNPQSETTTLTTKDSTITGSGTCGSDNVTDSPDYFSYHQVGQTGIYRLKLTNLDNNYEIADSFEVKGNLPFDVERLGATRINPFKANYWMTLKIKANEDFEGEVKETLPAGFEVTHHRPSHSESLAQNNWRFDTA